MLAMRDGSIKAQIDFVFLSRAPSENPESDRFIELVKSYNLPLVCFSYQAFKAKHAVPDGASFPTWRLNYDREVMARLGGFSPQICILAGYMLIVGPEMCRNYDLINLHPAAPGGPTGSWQEVIWRLIEKGASETGAMMHLVTPELDRGPVVSYCRFPLRGEPFDAHWQKLQNADIAHIKNSEGEQLELFRIIREHGLKREVPLILSTIRAFAEGRVRIEEKLVVDAAGRIVPGHDLSSEIDRAIRA